MDTQNTNNSRPTTNKDFQRKSSYSQEEVLMASKEQLFPSGTPRLPMPPMMMYDRFTLVDIDGGEYKAGQIHAELDINPDLWFFKCHFFNDPVMPGCLGLDGMWQMLGFYLGWRGHAGKGRALGAKEIKFTGQVLPTNKIVKYEVHIRRIYDRKLVLGVADGKMYVDDEHIYTAKDLKVGLFHDTSSF